jgi:hypothetical protein
LCSKEKGGERGVFEEGITQWAEGESSLILPFFFKRKKQTNEIKTKTKKTTMTVIQNQKKIAVLVEPPRNSPVPALVSISFHL